MVGLLAVSTVAYVGDTTAEPGPAMYPLAGNPLPPGPAWFAQPDPSQFGFGSAISSAGDVNADGFDDIIVGTPGYRDGELNEGAAFVFHGSANGLSADPVWSAESNHQDAAFAASVSSAGDVNADGFDDVIIGAHWWDPVQRVDVGRAFVYHGSASGLTASPAWSAQPSIGRTGYGESVSGAGDVNGDGFDDVIVGAPSFRDGAAYGGAAFVYHGSATGLSQSPAWTANPARTSANFGESVSSAGDVNADGYADIIVGARRFSNDQALEGAAYAYHGSASGLSANPAWIAESDHARAGFGKTVSSAGDVNADGFDDVIVAAEDYMNDPGSVGRAFVFHGSAGGLSQSADWSAKPDEDDSFGQSVDGAGDINADGYDDVIVGMPRYMNSETYEGATFVYLGSSTGLSPTSSWSVESDTNQGRFGRRVSAAGDVNADGFGDVLISASNYDPTDFGRGVVFAYHGQPINLAPVAVDDDATMDENTSATIAVLDNDSDAEGDLLVVESVTEPSHGTAIVVGDGSVTYTPAANFVGSDSFTYTISDVFARADTATVSITVNPVNEPPVFTSNPVYSTTAQQPYRYDVSASDADSDSLAITAVTLPAWLVLSDHGDGAAVVSGTATLADVGTHTIVLEVSDGEAGDTQSYQLEVAGPPSVGEDAGGYEDVEDTGVVTPAGVEDGCGCTTEGSRGALPGTMIVVALGAMRLVVRRRQRRP